MDRAKALALLPVITAYANGLTIQHKSIISNTWVDVAKGGEFDEINFSDSPDRYRLKPEPKYVYEIVNRGGDVWWTSHNKEYAQKELDRANINGAQKPYKMRTYVEVLEDGT
jgi:hypothetical protein